MKYPTPIDVKVNTRPRIVAPPGVMVNGILLNWYRWVDEFGAPVSTSRAIRPLVTSDMTLVATYR